MSHERADSTARGGSLADPVERLLVRDADAHATAIEELAAVGDERVIPHLVELAVIDAIAGDWAEFGFPEVLRGRDPPRYLELPECSWPGVVDALCALAEPGFDGDFAWVRWESWYSQQDIEPLEGFEEWKLRLYRSYLPPVGALLDAEHREFDLRDVRWGNCDRSFLAALNAPEFVPGEAVDASADGGEYERYLEDDHLVFGFTVGGRAYAVPRWVIFPHEMLNAEIGGRPLSLTYCTLCNAPILYDREVEGRTLTFGNSGMLLSGNKLMYDEETESLWSQHRGVPLAGPYAGTDATLDALPVTQTEWGDWKADHPDTLAVDLDTGYDYDYRFYDGHVGFFHHYWDDEDVIQPGVRKAESELPEKADVYGVSTGPSSIHIYPETAVEERWPLTDEVEGRDVVVALDPTGDVAVYEAPPLPVERDGDALVDAGGTRWEVTRDALLADGDRRERVPGRHGLWFAFRTQYDEITVVTGEE